MVFQPRLLCLLLALALARSASATQMDSSTYRTLTEDPQTIREVIFHFAGQPDLTPYLHASRWLKALTPQDRTHRVVELLKESTHQQAAPLWEYLAGASVDDVSGAREIWITNSLWVRATSKVIQDMIALGVGESVSLDRPQRPSELFDFSSSWAFKRTWGPEFGWGVRKIHAPEAWESGARGQNVIVAIVDTGANVTHPDLIPSLWTNPGESGIDKQGHDKATNGIDDDGNGFVDDIHGWNFEEQNNTLTDFEGHGTKTAGVVAGAGTGGLQTGVAPAANLMILRTCCDSVQTLFESHSWEAMQYAMENGARVISMSLTLRPNGKASSARWRRAGEALLAANILHVNSAGNLGSRRTPLNIGIPASNPPAWFHPGEVQGKRASMVSVGATDEADRVRKYSSSGPVSWEGIAEYQDYPYARGEKPGLIKPELCAPSQVPSLDKTGSGYVQNFGGTSSATPHVAGAAALLFSLDPTLSIAQITEALENSAAPVETGFNNHCGAGRLDVQAALKYVLDHFPAR